MKSKLISITPILIFIFITLFSTRNFIFNKDYVYFGEFFGSTNYIFFLRQVLDAWGNYPGLGYSNIEITTNYGVNPIFGVIPATYFLPHMALLSIVQLFAGIYAMKIYILLSIFLPFFGMYLLARFWFRELTKKPLILNSLSLISALIYGLSGQMSARISAGHLYYSLAHGLFPILLLYMFSIGEVKKFKLILFEIAASGLIIGLLIGIMPHLLSLYVILLFIYIAFFLLPDRNKVKTFLTLIAVAGIIGILLNIYIWLPSLIYKEKLAYIKNPYYSTTYVNTSRSFKLAEIIANTSGAEKAYLGEAKYENILKLKLIIPFTALIGLILVKNKKKSKFLFFTFVAGIVFSMGVHYPFETVYRFLFSNIFLFKPFREVGKFMILHVLAMSLLVPYVLFYIYRRLKKIHLSVLIFIFIIYILLSSPSFTSGDFANAIVAFKLPEKYEKLNSFLSAKSGDYTVAIYPNDKYVGHYSWYPKSLQPSSHFNIFHFFFPLKKRLALSGRTVGDWSSRYLDYLEGSLDKPKSIQRLGNAMIRYVIVDKSTSGHKKIVKILQKNDGVKIVDQQIAGFYIFEIKNYNTALLSKRRAVYYFGDVSGINYIPANIALINLDSDQVRLLKKNYSDQILLYNSSLDDVFYTSLGKYNFSFFPEVRFPKDTAREFYFPGEYLRYLTQKGLVFYNPEIIRAEGQGNKIIKRGVFKKGKYKILLSTISGQGQSNSLKIGVGDQVWKKNNFRKKLEGVEWINLGVIDIKSKITDISLENLEPGSLYIDYLLLVPLDDFNRLRYEFNNQIKSKKILEVGKMLDESSFDSNKKSIYVLSQNFSPNWDICNSEVMRVNFYAAGSFCDTNQTYEPRFKPRQIYKISLYFSLVLYLFTIFVLFKLYSLKYSNYKK